MLDRRDVLFGLSASLGITATAPKGVFAHEVVHKRIGEPIPALERAMRNVLERSNTPGGQFAVIKDGELYAAWSHGIADLSTGRAASLHDIFMIGSITKTVTALIIVQLAEEGKVDLDADVSERLGFVVRNPYFPDSSITLRHILTHTAAMSDGDYSLYDKSYAPGILPPSPRELVTTLYASEGSNFVHGNQYWLPMKPGLAAYYCNASFGIAALVIESVTGRPAWQHYHDTLFEPAGLRDMTFDVRGLPRDKFMIPYGQYVNGKPHPESNPALSAIVADSEWTDDDTFDGLLEYSYNYSFASYADGGIRTSILGLADLARLYLNRGTLNDYRIVSTDGFNEMLSSNNHFIDSEDRQGIGFAQIKYGPNDRAPAHGGHEFGSKSSLIFDPNINLAFVSNVNNGGTPTEPAMFGEAFSILRRSLGV